MSNRLGNGMVVALLAIAIVMTTPAVAGDRASATTEDILIMVDGRELHGLILDESSTEVVFKFVDRRNNLETRLTLKRSDISRIKRAAPIMIASDEPSQRRTTSADDKAKRYGRAQGAEGIEVATVYVVPMKGQMGTDIHTSIYEKVIEDIQLHDPKVVILVLESSDFADLMLPVLDDPKDTRGLLLIEEYRDLVKAFKQELPNTRQVIWVKDSVGFSSMLALAWDELYMSPDARLAGLGSLIDRTGADKWSDTDVRAKMSAAYTAYVKSFLEYGGYGMELADAMLWPEKTLSASFKGREVVWSPNELGEFVVDSDTEKTVGFRAKVAEDLLISDGTVDSLDDLTFLLGYREYREVGAKGAEMVDSYVHKWRTLYDQTQELYKDYFQHRSWAGGAETVKWLGRAKQDLEKIIRAMGRYEAVESRWRTDMGVTKMSLEIEVEKMREQIRSMKRNRGRGGGGRGGGFGSGGGPG